MLCINDVFLSSPPKRAHAQFLLTFEARSLYLSVFTKTVFIVASRGRPLMQPWWNTELLNPKANRTHIDVNSSDADPNNLHAWRQLCAYCKLQSHGLILPQWTLAFYYRNLWPVFTIWWHMLSIWLNTCLPQCFPGSNSWQSQCGELTTLMRVRFEVNYPIDKTIRLYQGPGSSCYCKGWSSKKLAPTACCSNSDLVIDAFVVRILLSENASRKEGPPSCPNCKLVPVHSMKAYGGGGIAPLILNLGCR
jgi:hypothetical protein